MRTQKARRIVENGGLLAKDSVLSIIERLEASEIRVKQLERNQELNLKIKQAMHERFTRAEAERDELGGALKASSDNAVTWMKRALKAEIEIERRDAAASEPVGLVIADVFGDGDRYLKVKPINTTGLFIGRDLLYAAAPPAVLPPLKKITSITPTDWHRGVVYGWNGCIEMALKLGTQPQKPVFMPKSERVNNGYYFDMDDIFVALDAAGVTYKVAK